MFGYIYETTNLINGYKYIGKKTSSTFVEDYFGSGIAIRAAIKKYGKENFSVQLIKECDTREELSRQEVLYIEKFQAYKRNDYYNISAGGEGGNTYAGKSPDEMKVIKEKISKGNSGSNNGNRGQYVGRLNPMYGKHHSIESRIARSETLKKQSFNHSHPMSKEALKKRSEYMQNCETLWKVINIETGEEFSAIDWKRNSIKKLIPQAFEGMTKYHYKYLSDVKELLNNGYLITKLIRRKGVSTIESINEEEISSLNKRVE